MARHAVMVRQLCVLQPFAPDSSPPLLVRVEAVWQASGAMAFSFGLRPGPGWDSLEGLRIPSRTGFPQRRDGLWDHTCFEAFLGWPNSPRYWELNAAANGDWNLYAFSAYRSPAELVDLPQPPQIELRRQARDLRCDIQLDLPPCWPEAMQPEIGLAMVVEEQEGRLSYWALSHPGDQPDFHDRRAFLPT